MSSTDETTLPIVDAVKLARKLARKAGHQHVSRWPYDEGIRLLCDDCTAQCLMPFSFNDTHLTIWSGSSVFESCDAAEEANR